MRKQQAASLEINWRSGTRVTRITGVCTDFLIFNSNETSLCHPEPEAKGRCHLSTTDADEGSIEGLQLLKSLSIEERWIPRSSELNVEG